MWRRPAAILDINEAGVTIKFRGQTYKVAGYCVRRKVGPKDVGEVK